MADELKTELLQEIVAMGVTTKVNGGLPRVSAISRQLSDRRPEQALLSVYPTRNWSLERVRVQSRSSCSRFPLQLLLLTSSSPILTFSHNATLRY